MMDKEKQIGELLGIKQEDIAMLLQIVRSKWSMYVSGKRDLPVAAKLKLSEMLAFVKQLDGQDQHNFEHIETQKVKTKKFLEKQLATNKHKQLVTSKKLESHQKKYEATLIALQLSDFLATKEEQTVLQVIRNNAKKDITKNGLDVQEPYVLKLWVLQQEELKLNERLLSY
ncbi:hypothetical protein [Flavobacterium sp. B183]|uniref:hypothetical protein n=1 Tax=Flavobacterium sp. B183 TaxID=907046 RepID=UPI00201EDA76|nr:hypothetical protein [Flavobacterium sp. B183]URC11741.1 hypothetical protein M4I44_16780 [Flavobacterium sp. B183]